MITIKPAVRQGKPEFLVFFANWQSQAGRLLFEATAKSKVKDLDRAFLFELHDRVIKNGFSDGVARQPEAQVCAEVACGLEGARRRACNRRIDSGSADCGLWAMRRYRTRLSHARIADRGLHRQRTERR